MKFCTPLTFIYLTVHDKDRNINMMPYIEWGESWVWLKCPTIAKLKRFIIRGWIYSLYLKWVAHVSCICNESWQISNNQMYGITSQFHSFKVAGFFPLSLLVLTGCGGRCHYFVLNCKGNVECNVLNVCLWGIIDSIVDIVSCYRLCALSAVRHFLRMRWRHM